MCQTYMHYIRKYVLLSRTLGVLSATWRYLLAFPSTVHCHIMPQLLLLVWLPALLALLSSTEAASCTLTPPLEGASGPQVLC